MKKLILIITFLLTFMMTTTSFASADDINFNTPITVNINGKYIDLAAKPFLYKGLTFVPIRFISQAFCAQKISWDAQSKKATVNYNGSVITVGANEQYGYVGNRKINLGAKTKIVNDRLYLPVRFITEALGASVSWDSQTYTVDVKKSGLIVCEDMTAKRPYTDDDIYWLSRIINAESGAEPLEGKIAVGNTVLNRVESKEFPNSIYGVIFDRKYGVQYQPTQNGTIYNKPLGDSVIAAKRALEGENVVDECMYFLNPKIATNFWIPQNRKFYASIGNHDFYI